MDIPIKYVCVRQSPALNWLNFSVQKSLESQLVCHVPYKSVWWVHRPILCACIHSHTNVQCVIQTKRGEKNKTKATPPAWCSLLWLLQLQLWCYILQIASVSVLMSPVNSWNSDSGNSSLEKNPPKNPHKYWISDELCIVRHLLFGLTRKAMSIILQTCCQVSSIVRSAFIISRTHFFPHGFIFPTTASMSCCMFYDFRSLFSLFSRVKGSGKGPVMK